MWKKLLQTIFKFQEEEEKETASSCNKKILILYDNTREKKQIALDLLCFVTPLSFWSFPMPFLI